MAARYPVVALAGTLFLAACASEIPLAQPDFPTPTQPRMMAAYHWEQLAADVTNQFALQVGQTEQRIYVAPAEPTTPFSEAFHGFLTEALHQQGIVASEPDDSVMVMSYDVRAAVGHRGNLRHTDLIVSTQVIDAGDILFKSSDIFYVNAADMANYMPPPPQPVIETRPRLVRLGR